MDTIIIYSNLKSELNKKKIKLSDLKKKSTEMKVQMETLRLKIEEDINGLGMIFDYMISQKENQ